jgi:hypothetical protein
MFDNGPDPIPEILGVQRGYGISVPERGRIEINEFGFTLWIGITFMCSNQN